MTALKLAMVVAIACGACAAEATRAAGDAGDDEPGGQDGGAPEGSLGSRTREVRCVSEATVEHFARRPRAPAGCCRRLRSATTSRSAVWSPHHRPRTPITSLWERPTRERRGHAVTVMLSWQAAVY